MRTRMLGGLLLLTVVVAGCGHQKPVSQQELVAYINDKSNHLVQVEEVKGIRVQVSYKPSSLLVLQELEEPQKKDTAAIQRLERKYHHQYYFIVKFSKDKKEVIRELGSFGRYSDMLQVLAFDMSRHINLTALPADTLPVADYYFDQTFGTSDGNTVLISFDKSRLAGKKSVDVNIGECGLGTGNMKFSFAVADLENVPALNYSISN